MPQHKIVCRGGRIGVTSFTDGYKEICRAEAIDEARRTSEEQVIAMGDLLWEQGEQEEAELLLNRYLALKG